MVRAMNRSADPQRCSKKIVALPNGRASDTEIFVDGVAVLFYYCLNAGKEVIEKYMSSKHSEVAET